MRTDLGFARTVCDCADCSEFCHWMPGFLLPDDLTRLAGTSEWRLLSKWALQHLLASQGSLALWMGKQFRVPTIVPARQENGCVCHWLADGRCSVHADAPFGCAFFDTHQEYDEGMIRSQRSTLLLMSEVVKPQGASLYYRVWEHLVRHDRIAPDRATSRARYLKTLNP